MENSKELFNNGGTCFLSPHPDDTVMSGLFVIKDHVLPKPYFLFTIFGDSDSAPYVNRALYPNEPASVVRYNEDLAFSKELGMEYLALMEPCCKKKLGHVIFDPLQPLEEALVGALLDKIYNTIKVLDIQNIVVQNPFGEKQHYDHRVVKAVGEKLAARHGYKVFLLDDIPYSRTVLTDSHSLIYEKTIMGKSLEYKHAIMNIYECQMMDTFHNFIDANNIERLFMDKTNEI